MSTLADTAPVTRPRPRLAGSAATYGAGAIAVLLAAWWLAAAIPGFIPERVLPSPWEVVTRFGTLLADPFSGATLVGHAAVSLQRWGLGVLAALALGLPVGIALAWLPPLRAVVTPAFELIRYIPPFAWVPIAVLWFGASTTTQALIVFIAAFPACIINTQLAVAQVDPILVRAARTLGASSMTTLGQVVLPVAAPTIFTGLRIAFSNGWMALVGAELVVGKQGLGFLISQGQINDSAATILVGMTSIGVLGFAIDALLQRVQKFVLPWKPALARPLE
ncbi:MAG: ABC-type nitrate/sulfonate/bicarbonate transport system, permease component [Ramlibacter sp.]|jgi:ABC-type nitrate/sulfonate/bicarbonate transport system permease component|nr:ABC-type nitrate/sulfonate/bicarbonate transport system, permease component [Ramlibacter sp.]